MDVALLAEGVDRNIFLAFLTASAWGALLAEGVDRNSAGPAIFSRTRGRPPRGGRG